MRDLQPELDCSVCSGLLMFGRRFQALRSEKSGQEIMRTRNIFNPFPDTGNWLSPALERFRDLTSFLCLFDTPVPAGDLSGIGLHELAGVSQCMWHG